MENGYTYSNQNGQNPTAYAEKLSIRTSGKRNALAQKKAGGEERLLTDEGGHLIAYSLNGSNTQENLVAMDRGLNRGLYRSNELAIKKAIERAPENNISMLVHTNGSPKRPDVIQVTARMQNQKGTIVDVCHNSYTNINKKTQEKLFFESGTHFLNYQETLTKERRTLANLASAELEKMKVPDGLNTGWTLYTNGNQTKSSLSKISIAEKSSRSNGKASVCNQTSRMSSGNNSQGIAGISTKSHSTYGTKNTSTTSHGGRGTGGTFAAGHGGYGTGNSSTAGHGGHGTGGASTAGHGRHGGHAR